MKIRQQVEKICKSIEETPLDWTQNLHTFRHKKTGLEIWTANGIGFISLYRTTDGTNVSEFGDWTRKEKKAIYKAMCRHQDYIINYLDL